MKGALTQRKIILTISTILILTLTISGCSKRSNTVAIEPRNTESTGVLSPTTGPVGQPTTTTENPDSVIEIPSTPGSNSAPTSAPTTIPTQPTNQTGVSGPKPAQATIPKPTQAPEQSSAPEPTQSIEPTKVVVPSKPYVMIGDTMEEVVAVMGPPASIYNNYIEAVYWYNVSSCNIFFYNKGDGMKVIGWSDYDNYLKVCIVPKDPNAPPITIGSTKEDVSRSRGTPDWNDPYYGYKHFDNPSWRYQNGDFIDFDQNYKVSGWSNVGGLNVKLGKVDPSAPPVTIGSTLQDVVNTLGTPIVVHNGGAVGVITSIGYSDCNFNFVDGKVINLTNNGNPQVIE